MKRTLVTAASMIMALLAIIGLLFFMRGLAPAPSLLPSAQAVSTRIAAQPSSTPPTSGPPAPAATDIPSPGPTRPTETEVVGTSSPAAAVATAAPASTPTLSATVPAPVAGQPAVTQSQALAPDFTLNSAQGTTVTLSAYRDEQNVVLVFYRGQT